jgi:hypothetical protein
MAYYRLEPFGEERADLRNARLLAMLATVNGDGSKDYSAADFMMDFGSDGPDEVDVADKTKAIFGGMVGWSGRRADNKGGSREGAKSAKGVSHRSVSSKQPNTKKSKVQEVIRLVWKG